MCSEFRQACDKIGACRAISDFARSENVLSGVIALDRGGPRQLVGAHVLLKELENVMKVTEVTAH